MGSNPIESTMPSLLIESGSTMVSVHLGNVSSFSSKNGKHVIVMEESLAIEGLDAAGVIDRCTYYVLPQDLFYIKIFTGNGFNQFVRHTAVSRAVWG